MVVPVGLDAITMQIGKYEIVGTLGRGGMGIVYKARNPEDGSVVAIKMLTGMGAIKPEARMRLVREARTVGQLAHPNIVTVYDIGQHDGWLYIVMEYLEGFSLDQFIARQRFCLDRGVTVQPKLSLHAKLRAIVKLCAGLDFAHSKGIVHRDIKPGNIFVRLQDTEIKIVDFGISKLLEMTNSMQTVGKQTQLAGTWLYMSPEQVNRIPVDKRSDIWAVGVTLYEFLTYNVPFNGSTIAEIARRICNGPTPKLNATDIGVADNSVESQFLPELNQVLERALAKKREDRYDTADELARALCIVGAGIAYVEGWLQVPPKEEWGNLERAAPRKLFDNQSQADSPSYSMPNLCFHTQNCGQVAFRKAKFSNSGLLLQVRQYLHQTVPFGLWWFTYGMWMLAIGMWVLGFSRPGRRFPFIAAILLVSIAGASLIGGLYMLSRLTIRRHCQSCGRKMFSCSKWTRFVNSKAEVCYRDCVSALQHGYYEDAVKLLTVFGSQDSQQYGVFRYTLEFWECLACDDHSAVLTTEERIDLKWKRMDDYVESYQSNHDFQPVKTEPKKFQPQQDKSGDSSASDRCLRSRATGMKFERTAPSPRRTSARRISCSPLCAPLSTH
jgi:serine/threonine protein kinase